MEVINEKDETDLKEITLSDIATIKIEEKSNSIALKGKNNLEKSFSFQVDLEGNEETLASAGMPSSADFAEKQILEENMKVLLLITGLRLKHFPYLFPCISPQFRDETLAFLFCDRYTGGIIKRDGEEWFYDAKKKLVISDLGVENKLTFSWDGTKLLPQDKTSSRLGNGVWDGFQLVWHPGEDSEGKKIFVSGFCLVFLILFVQGFSRILVSKKLKCTWNIHLSHFFVLILSISFFHLTNLFKATPISFENDFVFPK